MGQGTLPLGATVNKSGTNVTGVTFRIWAPNATGVEVRGTFTNTWDQGVAMTKDNATGYWAATVTNARPGQEYKYFIESPGVTGVSDKWLGDPRSFWIRNNNSVIYDQEAFDWGTNKPPPVLPPGQYVMYELHVGTFFDPDPADGRPGTFDDAITRLPYLQRLGVNVIALMPVSEFFTPTSWGYNPQFPFAIEDSYGGPDGLKRFVAAAHRLGMNVQMDVVHNHYGSAGEFPELMRLGSANAYFSDTNLPVGRTKWGPRPDYANTNVRAFITDNIRMFLDHYAIAGLRWDSPRNLVGFDANSTNFASVGDPQTVLPEGKSLLAEINEMIRTTPAYAGRWSVSEDSDLLVPVDVQTYGDPFLAGLQVTNASQSFDGHWQTSFHNVITPQIASSNPSPASINSKINEWSEPPGWRVIFTDNHDKAGRLNTNLRTPENPLISWRLANRMDPVNQTVAHTDAALVRTNSTDDPVVQKKVLLNAVLTLTAPGVPMLFMGQEFGATDTFDDGRRMDWREASRQSPLFRAHRDLVALRTSLPALQILGLGQNGSSSINGSVLSYARTNGVPAADQVFVALNFSPNSASLPLTRLPSNGNWYARMHTDWTIYGGGTAPATNALTTNNVLTLPAYSSVVLAKSPPPAGQLTDTAASVPDGWLDLFGLSDPAADDDADGLANLFEFQNGLDPLEKDSATVTYHDATRVLRASSNNPVVQHIAWAVDPVPPFGSASFAFLSNNIPGPIFTNPAGTYLRFFLNLTNAVSGYSFFSPNTNLAVVDTNRTNWAVFHGVTNFSANPDGDAFTNLQEFARGSDPHASNRPAIHLAGDQYDAFSPSANRMNYLGGNVWALELPRRGGVPGQFKFTVGDWSANWGDNPQADGTGDPGGSNIAYAFTPGNGIYRFRFNEETYAYQITYDPSDTNADGIQDAWVAYHGLTGANAAASADPDADGWSNLAEFARFNNANGTFMSPAVSDAGAAPKRMTVTGATGPLPVWQPNAANMTWSDQRMQWEWTGTFGTTTNLQFKFSQAANLNWSGGDSWGWNVGNSNQGLAVRNGSDNIIAPVVGGLRYRVAFNDLTGAYSFSNYPVSAEWWETTGLPGPLPASSGDPRWDQDPDGDGFSHRLEYALGGSPLEADGNGLSASWLTNAGGTNRLVLRWLQRTNGGAGLNFVPVLSTNLSSSNWSVLTASNAANTNGVPANHRRREVSVPLDGAAKFLRLQVTGP